MPHLIVRVDDVAVFADSADNNGTQDDVVLLSGRTLADVSGANFGLTATPPPGGDFTRSGA